MQSSGNFKVWAKDMKDFIFWHDKATTGLFEHFENKWPVDRKLQYADVKRCCQDKGLDIEVDKAL